jgi:hypothetical protein
MPMKDFLSDLAQIVFCIVAAPLMILAIICFGIYYGIYYGIVGTPQQRERERDER